jgi:hypothetical protein
MNFSAIAPSFGRTTNHGRTRAAVALLAAICGIASATAATRHVNVNLVSGADNGMSWADAYRTADGLARALADAVAGDEIWVAAGTYKPTTTTTRTIFFNLRSGIAVYGGFLGSETARDERDPAANVTILSADLAGDDPAVADNSYHVVNGNGADATAVLDGFTVTAGNANGPAASDRDRGGGLIFLNASNATIRNCRIASNRVTFGGGGTYIRSSSPTFVDCTWQDNQGASFGGAIDMFTNCNPSFTRCAFIGNNATRAGGVEVFGTCQPNFVNCIFRGNIAGSSGGGGLFVSSTSTVNLRHCTIARNSTSGSGSAVLTSSSTTRLYNSIVFDNSGAGGSSSNQLAGATTLATYSCVQNGFTGVGNVSTSPSFVDEAAGDLRLAAGSLCIDAARNDDSGAGNTLDFASNARFVDDPATADTGVGTPPISDMGAYEFQVDGGCPADLDHDGTIGLADLSILLSNFGCTPNPTSCAGDVDGDGDVELSDLSVLLAAFGSRCP